MTSARSLVSKLVPAAIKHRLRDQLVTMNVTHVHGPRSVRLAQNEAVVTCVVKNGGYYIKSFIQHYLGMGFKHIFFLDNGSTDDTLQIATSYRKVSVCASSLPISSYQRLFKKYLAQNSIAEGWCLDVDIDEFFDYPCSSILDLAGLLRYLDLHGYTALVTQMLDMFSDKPLSHLLENRHEDVKDVYRYFDLSHTSAEKYRTSALAGQYGGANELSDNEMTLYRGGIRKSLYGNNCLLTKHSLFKLGQGIELFPHVHFVDNARLADLSGVLLHYKLTSNALAGALQNRNGFTQNSKSYAAFIEVLSRQPDLMIKGEAAEEFTSASALVKSGFLRMSPAYETDVRSAVVGAARAYASAVGGR